jgi:DNA-binding NtrC family response regulator
VLKNHRWPGNVRELRNIIQRAFILAEEDIGVEALPLAAAREEKPASKLGLNVGASMPEVERQLILATLESYGGDKKKAAEVLKISIKTLYNRLREYSATR